jgi:hypothetical protein
VKRRNRGDQIGSSSERQRCGEAIDARHDIALQPGVAEEPVNVAKVDALPPRYHMAKGCVARGGDRVPRKRVIGMDHADVAIGEKGLRPYFGADCPRDDAGLQIDSSVP